MKRVYLSGPMTGIPDMNAPEFNRVAGLLMEKGYAVLNPIDHGCDENYSWSDYMKMDIADLITAELVATLPGWKGSKGAKLEVYIAKELGMKVVDYRSLTE